MAGPICDWNSGHKQRLSLALLLASGLVAALLLLVRLPQVADFSPAARLLVDIVQPASTPDETESRIADPPPAPVDRPEPAAEPEQAQISEASEADLPALDNSELADETVRAEDLEALRQRAVSDYLDREQRIVSASPVIEAQRRRLQGQYQPPTREPPKKIWENVEVDTLGRKVLRDGDCYKVLDDPNVGSREAFEIFGQFMAVCGFYKRKPQELPWVASIRERTPYLRNPDGSGGVSDAPQ